VQVAASFFFFEPEPELEHHLKIFFLHYIVIGIGSTKQIKLSHWIKYPPLKFNNSIFKPK
jgi:hypothetical protein